MNNEVKLTINYERLADFGFDFAHGDDMYLYVKRIVEWLESHNMNYTKEQYRRISDLKDIISCIDYGVE